MLLNGGPNGGNRSIQVSGNTFLPGETAVVRYKIPREFVKPLLDKPFIAIVPQDMQWTAGGGGGWSPATKLS